MRGNREAGEEHHTHSQAHPDTLSEEILVVVMRAN